MDKQTDRAYVGSPLKKHAASYKNFINTKQVVLFILVKPFLDQVASSLISLVRGCFTKDKATGFSNQTLDLI